MTPKQLAAEILEKAEKIDLLERTGVGFSSMKSASLYAQSLREEYFSPTNIKSLLSLMQEMAEALDRINAVASVSARQEDGEIKDILYESDLTLAKWNGEV